MTRIWPLSVVVLGAAVITFAQGQPPLDQQRSAWRYRRAVTLPAATEGSLVAVVVPPEVQARSQLGLRDLRLLDLVGREWPFLVHEDEARRVERRWTGSLAEAQRERRGYTTWTVDFGEPVTFDRLVLDLPDNDFAKRLSVDVSSDGAAWREVGGDYWIFDRPWQSVRVHDTTIDLQAGEARFVRLQADDTSSPPVDLRGVVALSTGHLPGAIWSEDVALEPLGTQGSRTRYRVPVPDGHPVRRLALDADDAAFARRVAVYERGRDGERSAGAGLVYRLRLPEQAMHLEDRELEVTRSIGGPLVVEIVNGDNPPLINPRVRVSGPRTMLLTAATGPDLTLYYGNSVTRAPVYEMEQFRIALASVPSYPSATVGPEVENPSFRQPPPLAFVAARGSAVPSEEWRFSRAFAIDGREDLYTFTVAPTDVARLRQDLGDLRVVDGGNRQVPYVLERDAATTAVALSAASVSPRAGLQRTSSFRLGAPGAGPVRVTALRLQVAEPFFERRAVVLQPKADAPQGLVPVATLALASPHGHESSGPVTVQLPLNGVRTAELVLEISDGDNAPLTLLSAQAVILVPRVTFQAAPGDYRLLLGNPVATSPSYELEALGREVLAYAAVPLEIPEGEVEPANPGYKRGMAELVRDAPPAAVLWTTLAVALIVLLVLTRRILTRTASGGHRGH